MALALIRVDVLDGGCRRRELARVWSVPMSLSTTGVHSNMVATRGPTSILNPQSALQIPISATSLVPAYNPRSGRCIARDRFLDGFNLALIRSGYDPAIVHTPFPTSTLVADTFPGISPDRLLTAHREMVLEYQRESCDIFDILRPAIQFDPVFERMDRETVASFIVGHLRNGRALFEWMSKWSDDSGIDAQDKLHEIVTRKLQPGADIQRLHLHISESYDAWRRILANSGVSTTRFFNQLLPTLPSILLHRLWYRRCGSHEPFSIMRAMSPIDDDYDDDKGGTSSNFVGMILAQADDEFEAWIRSRNGNHSSNLVGMIMENNDSSDDEFHAHLREGGFDEVDVQYIVMGCNPPGRSRKVRRSDVTPNPSVVPAAAGMPSTSTAPVPASQPSQLVDVSTQTAQAAPNGVDKATQTE